MDWLYFALATAVLWGVGQVVIKKGLSNLSPLWNVIISTTINLLIYLPFSLINGVNFRIDFIFLLTILMITSFYIFFFYAIEKGQLAFAGTIFATYPVITILLSFIFLQEKPSVLQLTMMILILVGSVLLSYFGTENKSKRTPLKTSWLAWAVLGAVTTGIGDFLVKVILNNVSIHTYNFYYPICYAISLIIFWFFDKKGRRLSKKIAPSQFIMTSIGVCMLTIGLLSFNFALAKGPVSLVTTVSSSFAALSVLLSYIFLKESINRKQFFALSLILIGILFIGFN